MFEDYYVGNGFTVKDIMEAQESVFKHFLGQSPNELVRMHSPFRDFDERPGCRFSYRNDVWYFVDNATYKNKLRFNCIELVMHMFNISFREAINQISNEVKLEKAKSHNVRPFKAKIKIIPKKLTPDNYFTRNYDLPINYLKSQRVISVNNYWANTRKHNYLKLNAFYNPKKVDTYCYVQDEGKELYFPGQEIKYVKETKNSCYSKVTDDYVVLVEGKKDQMILNYHYNLSCIGLGNVFSTPKVNVEKIYILLDPDEAGIANSKRLLNVYPNAINLTNKDNKMDIADLYKFDKVKLNELLKNINT